jgi:hypothetical protein
MGRMAWTGIAAFLSLVLTSGCGANCQMVCSKAWAADECNLQVPGETNQADLVRDCVIECENALQQTGELQGYDPNVPLSSQTFTLENEKQAAVWMDCVDESACQLLDEGVCPGGGIN